MRDLEKQPGNARIAVALLNTLAARGDVAGSDRAQAALGGDIAELRRRGDWIPPGALHDAFRSAGADASLARRVGRSLVEPEGMGLLLSHAGLATPEKAFRRSDKILPHDRPGDRFEPAAIDAGHARLVVHSEGAADADPLSCSVRRGMLEALPTLYGLLPARVDETECVHRGAAACVFEIHWRHAPRVGLVTGALLGGAAGAGGSLALAALAATPIAWILPVTVTLSVLGAAAGRSVDLARQLGAVTRGGLGQLAVLDQMDGVLAERMDALAKLDATANAAEATARTSPVRRPGDDAGREAENRVGAGTLRRLHRALTSLQRGLSELRDGAVEGAERSNGELRDLAEECLAATRDIRAVGAELAEDANEPSAQRDVADLVDIVQRAVAAVRPSQTSALEVALQLELEAAPVRCQPFQIEQVVIQLLMNAAEAMHGEGRVDVGLRKGPRGYEISIADTGEGIDPEILDRLFDPFFAPPTAGAESGLGLTICYRIVNQHGGELSVQSEEGAGTRVAVLLPAEV